MNVGVTSEDGLLFHWHRLVRRPLGRFTKILAKSKRSCLIFNLEKKRLETLHSKRAVLIFSTRVGK